MAYLHPHPNYMAPSRVGDIREYTAKPHAVASYICWNIATNVATTDYTAKTLTAWPTY